MFRVDVESGVGTVFLGWFRYFSVFLFLVIFFWEDKNFRLVSVFLKLFWFRYLF